MPSAGSVARGGQLFLHSKRGALAGAPFVYKGLLAYSPTIRA